MTTDDFQDKINEAAEQAIKHVENGRMGPGPASSKATDELMHDLESSKAADIIDKEKILPKNELQVAYQAFEDSNMSVNKLCWILLKERAYTEIRNTVAEQTNEDK